MSAELLKKLRDVAADARRDGRLPPERELAATLGVGRGQLRGVLAKVQKNASGFGLALKYQFEPLIARAQDVLQRVAEDAMSSGAGAAQTIGP